MNAQSTAPASPFLLPDDAASYLGVCARTLQRLRMEGHGPRFAKIGRKVGYRKEWLDQWVDGRSFTNTAQAKAQLAA
jgi:predicted DNA-binding transcriptional regulator AlpA